MDRASCVLADDAPALGRNTAWMWRRRPMAAVGCLLLALVACWIATASAAASSPVVAWGENTKGELGNASLTSSEVPVPVSLTPPPGGSVTAVSGGLEHSVALLSNGTVMGWGGNSSGQLGDGSTTLSEVPVAVSLSPPSGFTVTAVAAGAYHSLALLSNGTESRVMSWGNNNYGELGDGNTSGSDVPVTVSLSLPHGVTVAEISAGSYDSLALLSSGHVMAWGIDEEGQLGDGKATNSDVPVSVCAVGYSSCPNVSEQLSGVRAVSAGTGGQSLALLASNQAVVAWGFNGGGQLGDGTITNSAVPVPVCAVGHSSCPNASEQLTGVTTISAGGGQSLALRESQTLAWGENTFGELGNGDKSSSDTPVAVSGLGGSTSGVASISAGKVHSLALLAGGTVMAWGYNGFGQLGDATKTESDVPVAVCAEGQSSCTQTTGELREVAAVAASEGQHSLALVAAPPSKPTVGKQPVGVTVHAGEEARFEAEASGNPTPTVQWWVSTNGGMTFTEVAGATGTKLTIDSTSMFESGDRFEAIFKNSQGEAVSDSATLTVEPPLAPPVVSKQPQSLIVEAGGFASFEAEASGYPEPLVSWEVSHDGGAFAPIAGNSDELDIASVSDAESGNEYEAVFENGVGAPVVSQPAKLTVFEMPTVTKQPVSVAVQEHESASFEAQASGFPAPSVHWWVRAPGASAFTQIPFGASSDVFQVPNALLSESGIEYEAAFENGYGPPVVSDRALLTVNPGPPTAVTGSALSVTQDSATLTATVNPNGTEAVCEIEYNVVPTSVGAMAVPCPALGSGSSPVPVSVSVPQGADFLTESTAYYFRVVANNLAGPGEGNWEPFETEANPPANPPEFGRCVKVPAGEGGYGDSSCQKVDRIGSYEWVARIARPHFTIGPGSTMLTLEPVKVGYPPKLRCRVSGVGEFTSLKTIGGVTLTLTGCRRTGHQINEECSNRGQPGEIVSEPLEGALGTEPNGSLIGIDLHSAGGLGPLMEFMCGSTKRAVTGSVIVTVRKLDRNEHSFSLTATSSITGQEPENLTGQPKDVPEESVDGGAPKGVGLHGALGASTEEDLEINTLF